MLQNVFNMQYFWLIMNSKIKEEALQNSKQLQEETKESKTFTQDIFKIDYSNTSKIFYQNSLNSEDVKVNNYLCYQQGQNLYKITEIIYEDKIIRIEDKFEVTVDPTILGSGYLLKEEKNDKKEKKCSRSIQKVRIFNKNINKETKLQKKDKKNIVKNIVKIFLSWLEKKIVGEQNSEYSNSLEQLRNLLDKQNFNNRLIQKMVNSKQICRKFMGFLLDNAEDQIKYSRIQDKQSHYQALQIYKGLFQKGANSEINNSSSFIPNSSQPEYHSRSVANQGEANNNHTTSNDNEVANSNGNNLEAGVKVQNEQSTNNKRKNKIQVFHSKRAH